MVANIRVPLLSWLKKMLGSDTNEAIAQIFRFASVGTLVALTYFTLFLLLAEIMSNFYANSIAYVISVAFSYFAQSIWTYRKGAWSSVQALRFGASTIFAYTIASVITSALGPALGWSNFFAGAIVIVVLPIANYISFKFWVFQDR